MNNKHQEKGAPTGPLIFTLPAFSCWISIGSMGPGGQLLSRKRAIGSGIGSNLHSGSLKNRAVPSSAD